jgi:hypothetical protein
VRNATRGHLLKLTREYFGSTAQRRRRRLSLARLSQLSFFELSGFSATLAVGQYQYPTPLQRRLGSVRNVLSLRTSILVVERELVLVAAARLALLLLEEALGVEGVDGGGHAEQSQGDKNG